MNRTLLSLLLLVGGLCALYPDINIVLWAATSGMLWTLPWQGLVTASVFGPLGGALMVGAIWLWKSKDKR